jgi:hypothetical protein
MYLLASAAWCGPAPTAVHGKIRESTKLSIRTKLMGPRFDSASGAEYHWPLVPRRRPMHGRPQSTSAITEQVGVAAVRRICFMVPAFIILMLPRCWRSPRQRLRGPTLVQTTAPGLCWTNTAARCHASALSCLKNASRAAFGAGLCDWLTVLLAAGATARRKFVQPEVAVCKPARTTRTA